MAWQRFADVLVPAPCRLTAAAQLPAAARRAPLVAAVRRQLLHADGRHSEAPFFKFSYTNSHILVF